MPDLYLAHGWMAIAPLASVSFEVGHGRHRSKAQGGVFALLHGGAETMGTGGAGDILGCAGYGAHCGIGSVFGTVV
jgi:hypothetical protein